MNTAELKRDLLNRITKLKNVQLMEDIQKLLDFELEQGEYRLTSKQLHRIEEANAEYSEGKVMTNEDANEQIQKWLDEVQN
jgi:hypothetical protein